MCVLDQFYKINLKFVPIQVTFIKEDLNTFKTIQFFRVFFKD